MSVANDAVLAGWSSAGETTVAAVLDRYAVALVARRLSRSTSDQYRQIATHFIAWWRAEHPQGQPALSQSDVEAFVSIHLPQCTCPHRGRRTIHENRAALRHLLHVLQVPTRPTRPITPVEAEVTRYDAYLRDVCGAAGQTRAHRTRHVREFLTSLFGDQDVCDAAIRPADLTRFVTTRAQTCRPGSAAVITDGLRSYVRYLELQGRGGGGLRDGIPSVARWRLASVPVHLQSSEVQQLLISFDRRTPRGCRDEAMARCLVVLGLRAGEVARVALGDLDWRASTVTIRETKTHRARVLPLPPQVGRALVRYLRTRPKTSSDRVFVRIGVLDGDPVTPSVVRSAIRQAYRRAGFPPQYTGTHRLRHTAATRLITAGASIKEVADVLGHASLDSTAIYTKVDLPRLRAVALPWTEVTR